MADITSLTKVTDVYNIQPGQYITCDYTVTTANTLGTFSNLGSATKDLLTTPLTGAGSGSFNFICIGWDYAGRPYLIADRVVHTSFSLSSNSSLNTTSGTVITVDTSISANLRVLNRDTWDKAIVKGGVSGIAAGDALWNFTTPSWTFELPSDSTDGASNYILGGTAVDTIATKAISTSDATVGLRPVMTINEKISYRGNPGLASGITLVTDPSKLVPGTAISCEYTVTTKGAIGTYANLGSATKDPLPDYPSDLPDGTFYWVCVGYTPAGYPKCFADRNIQSNISWTTLASSSLTTTSGTETAVSGHKCSLRIPNSIPNRHIDIPNSKYGEWDAIFTLYNDHGFKASNELWNTKYSKSFTTAILSDIDDAGDLADGTWIIARGMQDGSDGVYTDKEDAQSKYSTSATASNLGFRPVFIYTEIDASSRGRVGTTLPAFDFTSGGTLQPGYVIPCSYTSSTAGAVGTFSEFGTASAKDWILAEGESTPDGRFNFICVGYTPDGCIKLAADRNIQINISWNTLNTAGFCITTGTDVDIDGQNWRMRLFNSTSTRILSDTDYGEWDAIISLMTRSTITKASNPEIWNCENNRSWTMATIATTDDAGTLGTLDNAIARGMQDTSFVVAGSKQTNIIASTASKSVGFRPVIWLKKTTPSSKNPYRLYVRSSDDSAFSYLDYFS